MLKNINLTIRQNFMKSNLFLQVIIGAALLFATVCRAESVSNEEALSFASTKGKQLLTSFQEPDLEKRYRELDAMFVEHIDIDYVSKFVVGKYWRLMTPEQKKAYQDAFVRYGLSFYKTLPLEYAQNLKYDIKGAEQDGKFVNVATNIKLNLGTESQEITLIFRLHKTGEKIKAVDVKVAESSLLLSYRGKFYEMIAQNDGEIDWFIEELSDLAASMENSLRENVSNQQKPLELPVKSR